MYSRFHQCHHIMNGWKTKGRKKEMGSNRLRSADSTCSSPQSSHKIVEPTTNRMQKGKRRHRRRGWRDGVPREALFETPTTHDSPTRFLADLTERPNVCRSGCVIRRGTVGPAGTALEIRLGSKLLYFIRS